MSEQFRNVTFTEDTQLKVRGERYEFSEGDTTALPISTASKAHGVWGVAEAAGDAYEVADQDVDDTIGVIEDASSSTENEDDSEPEGDDETCQVEKSDGEICGRELPCQYHSE